MQAGREIRVMVAPGAIDDDAATLLSYEIAREIEKELEYPGPDQGHGDPRVARRRVRPLNGERFCLRWRVSLAAELGLACDLRLAAELGAGGRTRLCGGARVSGECFAWAGALEAPA